MKNKDSLLAWALNFDFPQGFYLSKYVSSSTRLLRGNQVDGLSGVCKLGGIEHQSHGASWGIMAYSEGLLEIPLAGQGQAAKPRIREPTVRIRHRGQNLLSFVSFRQCTGTHSVDLGTLSTGAEEVRSILDGLRRYFNSCSAQCCSAFR